MDGWVRELHRHRHTLTLLSSKNQEVQEHSDAVDEGGKRWRIIYTEVDYRQGEERGGGSGYIPLHTYYI